MGEFSVVSLLTGAVGGGIVTSLWNTARDFFTTRKDGRFAALYLSVALESYAGTLLSNVFDSLNHESSNGHTGAQMGNIDELNFPEDLDWKSIGIKATTTSLTFKIKIEGVISMLSASWEFDDDGETEIAVREHAATIGLEAWGYAEYFRRAWDLPKVEADDSGKTVKSYLATLDARFGAERAEREARARKYREANPDDLFG